MTTPTFAADWAARTTLEPLQLDCVTTLMLKIIDGKCKMNADEKTVMAAVYDVVCERPGRLLGADVHALIERARAAAGRDEALIMEVYEQRLNAETMISRPVMKGFKAWLRGEGILADGQAQPEEA